VHGSRGVLLKRSEQQRQSKPERSRFPVSLLFVDHDKFRFYCKCKGKSLESLKQ
jgi:hypothetical protein